jgi:hypothetical protein
MADIKFQKVRKNGIVAFLVTNTKKLKKIIEKNRNSHQKRIERNKDARGQYYNKH